MQRYLLCLILGALLLLTGCSGGDVSSSSANDTHSKGSVAVLLTDGPADNYESIWVKITEISLISDGDGAPVVVFESDDPEGWEVDLLDLRDQEALVTVNEDIPAGHYRKIRLRIADIRVEGGNAPCDKMELNLPDGKIDLKPKSGFDVIPGETIAVHIDIDCDKSMDLHPADKSGKCIFQPAVFVEIDTPDVVKKCPRVLKGKIKTIQKGHTGFALRLGHGRGLLTVNLADDVVIFGKNGMPIPPEELEPDQRVHVRGQLDNDGNLRASDIVVGYVLLVKGMVETPYDAEEAMFSLDLMLSKFFPNLPDFTVDIDVSENTLVMTGCDQIIDPSMIQAGMMTRVVAKVSPEDWSIKAIAVLLKDVDDTDMPTDDTDIPTKDTDMPTDVTGMLAAVSDPDGEGGYTLSIEVGDSETAEMYMPAGVEPIIEVPGEDPIPVSIEELQCGRMPEVIVTVESENASPMIASYVRVNAVVIEGNVEEKVVDGNTVVVELEHSENIIEVISVPPTAIIEEAGSIMPPTNEDIDVWDFLQVIGLNSCEGDGYDYQAFKVSITSIN